MLEKFWCARSYLFGRDPCKHPECIALRDDAAATCEGCLHSDGRMCVRGPSPFTQRYETTYTDSDFCGPSRRYFKRRFWFPALRALSEKGDEQ